MRREELAEKVIRRLAERWKGRDIMVERADPKVRPMRKTALLGKTPVARFVVFENVIYWSPIMDGDGKEVR